MSKHFSKGGAAQKRAAPPAPPSFAPLFGGKWYLYLRCLLSAVIVWELLNMRKAQPAYWGAMALGALCGLALAWLHEPLCALLLPRGCPKAISWAWDGLRVKYEAPLPWSSLKRFYRAPLVGNVVIYLVGYIVARADAPFQNGAVGAGLIALSLSFLALRVLRNFFGVRMAVSGQVCARPEENVRFVFFENHLYMEHKT